MFEELYLSATQDDRQPKIVAIFKSGISESICKIKRAVDPDQIQHFYRRNIERPLKSLADADRSMLPQIIIVWRIDADRSWKICLDIPKNSVRGVAEIKRLCVDNRLKA